MNFIIHDWHIQIVLMGSVAVLEAMRGGDVLSQELSPMDSPRERAYQLIQQPACSLRSHRS